MKVNTLTHRAPILKQTRARDNVIMLEGLEFNISKKQLREITELHNEGKTYNEISKTVKRDPYEVILALLHQTRRGYKMRPIRGASNG